MTNGTKSNQSSIVENSKPPIINTKAEISVEKIPTINITTNPTPDYVTIASFAIAILSFIVTILIIKKDGKQQSDIATKNREIEIQTWISNSRQKWINDLRDSISEFISIGLYLIATNQKTSDISSSIELQQNDKSQYLKNPQETSAELYENQRNINKQRIKIELLLNEKENNSQLLIGALKSFNDIIYEKDIVTIEDHIEKIRKYTREILKTEWDRTKSFNGLNSKPSC